jgi:two-component system, cell cycle sensor histidine kinase and response regulator CckA
VSFPAIIDYSRINRTKILVACALAASILAIFDLAVVRNVSLGFLYIIPLGVAAGFLKRWQIALLALGFALLRELGSPMPWFDDYLAHFFTIAAAFAGTGLLIKELAVNQQYMRERARALEERRVLEEQLRHAQRLEAVGRLAGGVAHDFNNLLSVIIGYSDFALSKVGADSDLGRDIEQIRKSADRAALLTRQLLVFSRRQKVEPRVLDLNELVSNLDRMLRRLIGEDIDLQLTLHEGLPRVRADAGQIEQVLMNLSLNARDAMPHGGRLVIETAEVDITQAGPLLPPEIPRGRFVRITVSDTGFGMDKQVQEHIFEPFFTTKDVGKGTGLGLSVVYGLVRQNNGHIWFHSAPGEGTSFTIYLPVTRGIAGEEVSEPAPPRRPARAGSGCVLLVEDYAPVRSLAAEILKNHGYSVTEVSDAAEALAISRRRSIPFDLLLTDVVMPGMSGRELAEEMCRQCPRMRVLYMSGYTNDPILQARGLPGGAAVIQKPFTSQSLIQAVDAALDKARPRDSDLAAS